MQNNSTTGTQDFYVITPSGQLVIHHAGLVDFLGRHGFCNGKYNNKTYLIRVQDSIIREVTLQEIIQFVNSYVTNSVPNQLPGGYTKQDLRNLLVRGSRNYFDKIKLEFLPVVDIATNKDEKDTGYIYFENCFAKITATGITTHPYADLLGKLIWSSQIRGRKFKKFENEPEVSVFEQFLFNVCNKDEERFRSLKSLIGYLLHSYKDLSLAKVIILVDEEIGELGDANGGTGKSIIAKAIMQIKSGVLLLGKNFDINKNFAFQRVELGTEILVIDDALKNEEFELYYNIITEGITVERKHKGEFFIPFEDSPKLCITTNFVLKSPEGNSSDRRKIEFEVSAFYNRAHTPEMDFGHTLFEDWDEDEWNRFDNTMLRYIQFYLQNGIIAPPKINITLRKLINDTGAEFVEFMDDKILEGVKRFHKKDTHDEFITTYPGMRKYYSSTNKFTKKMKRYFNDKGIEFTEYPAATKKYFILDDRNSGNTTVTPTTPIPVGNGIKTEIVKEFINDESLVNMKSIKDTPHDYITLKSKDERGLLIQKIKEKSFFAFDTETTGLDPHSMEIVGLAISIEPHKAYYIPMPEIFTEAQDILQEFQLIFEGAEIEKIAHNLKFDMQVLMRYGIGIKGKVFDTMIAHYLCKPDLKQHGLKNLCETIFNYRQIRFEDIVGKGEDEKPIREIPLDQVAEYASEDVDFTLQLKNNLQPELERINAVELFRNIEMPLVSVLAKMEYEGVNLNVSHLNELLMKADTEMTIKEKEIYKIAGKEFNIGSVKQLNEILFDKLDITPIGKKGTSGNYSTNAEVLQELSSENSIIPLLIEYKELSSIRANFIEKLPRMLNPITGKIHTKYNQAVAATGRLSSSDPNLQNVPKKRDGLGSLIRRAFISRDSNHYIVAADYSQIELRVMAHLSNDVNLVKAFLNDEDIHSATAAKLYGVAIDNIPKDDYRRKIAKSVNFGLNYGMTEFGLSKRLSTETGKPVSKKEAKEIIENYFENFEGVKNFKDEAVFKATAEGYAETLFHRRRELSQINSNDKRERESAKRVAVNMPVQGTAADIIKIAMININQVLESKKMRTTMIMQIHDELVFDVPKNELEEALTLIKSTMETAVSLNVPLKVDIGVGNNWLEAH